MIQSRQLEAFRAVMRTGAMTLAADAIHISQPAVSRLIRDLEQELGFALFHRRGNVVVPTAEATTLLGEVERSFVGLASISEFAENLRAGTAGSLKVAALPALSSGFLPRFVARFCRNHPHAGVVVDGLSSPEIRDRVSGGHYDIGMTAYPFTRESLVITPLHDPAVAVMPWDHRLAQRPVIHVQDLQGERLILLSKFRFGRQSVEVALQDLARRTPIETAQAPIACLLALEGQGIAVVDPFSASEFVDRGLVVRPFRPRLTIGTAVVYARDRPLSIVAREFHDLFLQHARAFLANSSEQAA